MIKTKVGYKQLEKLEIAKMRSWFALVSKRFPHQNMLTVAIDDGHVFISPQFKDDIFFNRSHLLIEKEQILKALKLYPDHVKYYIDTPAALREPKKNELKEYLLHQGSYSTLSLSIEDIFILNKDNDLYFEKLSIKQWQKLKSYFMADANEEFNNRLSYLEALLDDKSWHFFLAYKNNEIAGLAGYFEHKGLAAFCTSYVLNKYRYKGVHLGLIGHRLEHIVNNTSIEHIIAQAYEQSKSLNNLKKFKFETVFHSDYWTIKDCSIF